ncbi:hypothetical protein Pst134EB_028718 [Puccinia striiformis f. sp. tritici]|nr:hypothetical protein Pst134EB_028718 [Puccinia striiformis f. sp. tritici]
MWHRSAVSSEHIRFSTRLFLIYTAIAIASGSEELTSRSGHQLGDPAWIPPALSNLGQEKIHSDKHTYFANPWEEELLFPDWMSSHEEHAAAGKATTGYLDTCAREAQATHAINHPIDHWTAPPLIFKEIQAKQPSRGFHSHLQGNNCMTLSNQPEEFSIVDTLTVSDYLAAGLVDDTLVNFDFVKFDDYFNPEEGIPPFSGHCSVQESDSEHFQTTPYTPFDPQKSSVPPATKKRARSPSASQRNQVGGDSCLAGYLHKAQTRYTINHQINHHTAHPLIYKGIQEPGRSFYNHSPGDNCMASDSMEAINAISASDQLTQSSNGNPVAVSDYLVAGLIDDTFTNFDNYFNHKEAISPSSGYSSVQKWHLKDFPNPNCVQSDSAESSVAPSKDSHTTSPSAYQGNHVSMESNKEDKPWSPDLDHWTQNRSEHKIYEGVILLTGQSKGKKRKSFQSVESPYPIENFEQSRQGGKKRKSFQSLYSLQPRDNFRKLTLMDILNCKNVPQPIIDSLHDISKLLPQEIILAIIPWPKEQLELNKEDKFEFFKELEKAAQFFEDFKTYVMGSVSEEKDNTDWRVKKNYILNNPGKGKYNHTLWCALELWMKTHQKFIWHHLTDGRGNIFITSVKEFFNNIFFHGIEDLSRIISSHQ